MTILRQRLHRKNDEGTYDIIHLETSSDSVMQSADISLEKCLATSLPKCHSTDDQPTSLQDGEYLVSPSGKLFVGVNSHITVFEPTIEYKWKKYYISYSYTYYWDKYKIAFTLIYNDIRRYKSGPNLDKGFTYTGGYIRTTGYSGTGYTFDKNTGIYTLTGLRTLSGNFHYGGYGVYEGGSIDKGGILNNSDQYMLYVVCTGATSGLSIATPEASNRTGGAWIHACAASVGDEVRGDYIGSVSSGSRSAYPDDGISDSYWYVYNRSSRYSYRGSYIEDVVSTNANAYPSNGTSGGYWYVKQ